MKLMRKLSAPWGMMGILFLLVYAIYRLGPLSLELYTHNYTLTWYHWALLISNSLFMLYSEGYKGFQKAFTPRAVSRADYLSRKGTFWQTLLAPLFCMGYFFTTRKRKIVSYSLTMGIIILIIIFRHLPQPWRGVLDAGVVFGLSYGIITIFYFWGKYLMTGEVECPPEIPTSEE